MPLSRFPEGDYTMIIKGVFEEDSDVFLAVMLFNDVTDCISNHTIELRDYQNPFEDDFVSFLASEGYEWEDYIDLIGLKAEIEVVCDDGYPEILYRRVV